MSKPLPASNCTIHLLISPEVVALPVQSPIKFGAGSRGQSGHHVAKLRPTLVVKEMNVLPQAAFPNPLMGEEVGILVPGFEAGTGAEGDEFRRPTADL